MYLVYTIHMNTQTFTINNHTVRLGIQDEADESVAAEIFKHREYRIIEEALRSATSPIVDVGAHRGFFTLYARAFNLRVQILALEPEPKNLEALRFHLNSNQVAGVVVLAAALASKTGKRYMEVTEDSHNHKLIPLDKPRNEKCISVETVTLSDLMKTLKIEQVSVLKMDIEGGEYEVFESLADSVWEKIHAIIIEYHTIPGKKISDLETTLREHGFSVQKFPSKFDKTMGFFWAVNKRIKREVKT